MLDLPAGRYQCSELEVVGLNGSDVKTLPTKWGSVSLFSSLLAS